MGVVVYWSNADALICFLKNTCGHDFITKARKLDVAAEQDTVD